LLAQIANWQSQNNEIVPPPQLTPEIRSRYLIKVCLIETSKGSGNVEIHKDFVSRKSYRVYKEIRIDTIV